MYDAFLLLGFGGPEGPDEVMPFLRNVTRGRAVPDERLAEVAEHYLHFGGVSPINAQCRALLDAVGAEFERRQIDLRMYWGNRNWHPFVTDTVARMHADGVQRALVLATSAVGGYSGCRQYREDLASARAGVGIGAPELIKLRHFFNHPGFVAANADHLRAALAIVPEDEREFAALVFTAHSVPDVADANATRDVCPPTARNGASLAGRYAARVPPSTWPGSPLRVAGYAVAGAGRQRSPR
jgi:ferrochelatase